MRSKFAGATITEQCAKRRRLPWWAAAIRDADATLKSSGPDPRERGSPNRETPFNWIGPASAMPSPPGMALLLSLYHSKGHWFISNNLAESPVLLRATTRRRLS